MVRHRPRLLPLLASFVSLFDSHSAFVQDTSLQVLSGEHSYNGMPVQPLTMCILPGLAQGFPSRDDHG